MKSNLSVLKLSLLVKLLLGDEAFSITNSAGVLTKDTTEIQCYEDGCWWLDPCCENFSCHPFIQRCYNEPRREGEPCLAGYECAPGYQCEAFAQVCRPPATLGESCGLTRNCGPGLKCEAGTQACIEQDYTLSSGTSGQCGATSGDDSLKFLTYNIYQIFFFKDELRGERLIEWMQLKANDYDIVVMQETWEIMEDLRLGMVNAGYCHYVYDDRAFLDLDNGYGMGSGLAIFSKYPILEHDFTNFAFYCAEEDCLADKGVTYAKIQREYEIVHVLNTHLNACCHEWRTFQYGVIRDFIDSKQIPLDEMILISGDMNEDKLNTREKFDVMMRTLDAGEFSFAGNQISSADPETNTLDNGTVAKALDFVFYDKKSGRKAPDSASTCEYLTPKQVGTDSVDLSDHYPMSCNIKISMK